MPVINTHLAKPFKNAVLDVPHRVVMAPLTRLRHANGLLHPSAAEYYSQRAKGSNGGLLIAEATNISQEAVGYPDSPRIYTEEHVQSWKPVVQQVHEHGSPFFLQLWHTGRVSSSGFQKDNQPAVAPSAVRMNAKVLTPQWAMEPAEEPRALREDEMPRLVQEYRHSARLAMEAGFDGVEIHMANSYLLHQFLSSNVNQRSDGYGGSIENRCRLPLEVVAALVEELGSEKVAVRISPWGKWNDIEEDDALDLYTYLLGELAELNLAYVHIIEPRILGSTSYEEGDKNNPFAKGAIPRDYHQQFRKAFPGTTIWAGGYDAETGEEAVREGHADLVAYGRPYIANADLPHRLIHNLSLNAYDRSTFYGGSEKGYTDYPLLGEE